MKRLFILFLFIQLFSTVSAITLPGTTFEHLLSEIDAAILNSPQYIIELENRIHNLKTQQLRATSVEEYYNINLQLLECYENYKSDSTFYYIDRCEQIAAKAKRKDWQITLQLYRIDVYLQMNMLIVAKDELEKVNVHSLNHSQLMKYYVENHTLWVQIQKQPQALDANRLQEYKDKAQYYLDKIYSEATIEDDYCKYLLMNLYTDQNRIPEMIAYYETKMDHMAGMSQREIAENAGLLYDLNSLIKNNEQMYAWLLFAIDHAFLHTIRDYGPRLVTQLIERGDINHAYRYISFLLMQAVSYPDHRNLTILSEQLKDVSEKSKEIDQRKIQNNYRYFLGSAAIAVVLAIFFIVTIILLRKLSRQRKQLAENHEKLLVSQENLKQQVEETNRTALLLEEANRLKEAYIGQIFLLSNKNIMKIEDFRLTIYRLLKVGKNREALNIASQKESLWINEVKEQEDMFDETFLSIYPTFVEDFNTLLRKEEQYLVSSRSLNTDLRIYAFVWLGVNNSQKIANLLHLAPKTVYNIRSKVRSKALPSEEDFSDRVWKLNRVSVFL